ncbi:restriction endonuclease subunit S [Moraxella sp. FZFQ2102]|uniref:restriction endonuclease subunit S n=1 Tax=Moraxella sp. FZFQ2102 TaxID=2953752 RepID=UPI00209BDD90|nr:restriction endonuclease subunit S [Moraxella sp. FZFQ2102]USZ15594.1 restriction endonuclease subunit S [Moraxella sp. FZFQ2102]
MSEWVQRRLSTLGVIITGKTPSKDNPNEWGNIYMFITPTDYANYNKFANTSIRMLSEIGMNRHNTRIIPKNSCLVTCIGSDMGKVVINGKECFTNQQINSFIPNNEVIIDFIYYYFKDNEYLLKSLGSSGSAVPILNKTDFGNIEINLPPLPEQKAIADVLSALDDKIDLLHRQNYTLEQMAETLFRQWFVEEANENVGIIGDLVNLQSGYAFKSKDFLSDGKNSVIKIKNINGDYVDLDNTDYVDDSIFAQIPQKFLISSGDVLIAMTGAEIGKLGVVPKNKKILLLNQRVGLLKEKFKGANYLAYLQLKGEEGQDYINNSATGSAQPNISSSLIEKCPFPVIKQENMLKYSEIIYSFFEKKIFNLEQIQTLETLRDTLLPKLISGEVRVNVQAA